MARFVHIAGFARLGRSELPARALATPGTLVFLLPTR
jgi:hypothetical protein